MIGFIMIAIDLMADGQALRYYPSGCRAGLPAALRSFFRSLVRALGRQALQSSGIAAAILAAGTVIIIDLVIYRNGLIITPP